MTKEEFELKWDIFIKQIGASNASLNKRRVLKIKNYYFARSKGPQTEYRIICMYNVIIHNDDNARAKLKKFVITKGKLESAFLYNQVNNDELREIRKQYIKNMDELKELNKVNDMKSFVRQTYVDDDLIEVEDEFYDEDLYIAENIRDLKRNAIALKKQFDKLVKEQNIIKFLLKYFETL